jgi:hypothetical protein
MARGIELTRHINLSVGVDGMPPGYYGVGSRFVVSKEVSKRMVEAGEAKYLSKSEASKLRSAIAGEPETTEEETVVDDAGNDE